MRFVEDIRILILKKKVKYLKKYISSMEPSDLKQLTYSTIFDGLPLFYFAMKHRNIPILDYLINELQLDVNTQYYLKRRSCKPLVFAISINSLRVVQYLVSKGAHLDNCADGMSLLITTYSDIHNEKIIRWLVEIGADLNGVDENGNTLLFYAITDQKFDLAKLFISKGANINHINEDGQNILHMVALYYDFNFLNYAIEHGIVYHPANQGMTPSFIAALSGNHIAMHDFYKTSLMTLKELADATKIFSVNHHDIETLPLHFQRVEHIVSTENISLELSPEEVAKGSPFFNPIFNQSEYKNFKEYQNLIEQQLKLPSTPDCLLKPQLLMILERLLGFEDDFIQHIMMTKLSRRKFKNYKELKLHLIFLEANIKIYGIAHQKTIRWLSTITYTLKEMDFSFTDLMNILNKVLEQIDKLDKAKVDVLSLGWKKLSQFSLDLWLSYINENWKHCFDSKQTQTFDNHYVQFIKSITSISDLALMLHAWKFLHNSPSLLFQFISTFNLNINVRLPNNENFLHKAIKEQRPAQLVDLLLKAGCCPFRRNNNGDSPEALAQLQGYSDLFPLNLHSLQCLAAQVVYKNICYENLLPKAVSKFVSMF